MTPIRITRCAEIVHYWPFFVKGLEFTRKYLKLDYSLDTFRRILFAIACSDTRGFVMIVLDDDGTPLCFGAAYDSTPIFVTEREFDVIFLFHQPTHLQATAVLRRNFEIFCRHQRVKRYHMTTRVDNGHAIKCFANYGVKQAHVVMRRELR